MDIFDIHGSFQTTAETSLLAVPANESTVPIPKSFSALFVFALSILCADARAGEHISEIGAHQPILIVEKNVNRENSMVVYTKEDANGRFLADPADRNRPLLDFYWLMDGKNYKPVHGKIKNAIGKRLECQSIPTEKATHFAIKINDLKEVNSDIREPTVDVYASGTSGARDAEAQMSLGPSDGHMRIKLSSIYTEGRAFPPAVYAVTLKGEEIVNGKLTGKKVTRRYDTKSRPN